jgi:hypothetical protein
LGCLTRTSPEGEREDSRFDPFDLWICCHAHEPPLGNGATEVHTADTGISHPDIGRGPVYRDRHHREKAKDESCLHGNENRAECNSQNRGQEPLPFVPNGGERVTHEDSQGFTPWAIVQAFIPNPPYKWRVCYVDSLTPEVSTSGYSPNTPPGWAFTPEGNAVNDFSPCFRLQRTPEGS